MKKNTRPLMKTMCYLFLGFAPLPLMPNTTTAWGQPSSGNGGASGQANITGGTISNTTIITPTFQGIASMSADLSGSSVAQNLGITTTAIGSGVNGPANAGHSLALSLIKDAFPSTTAAIGELDPLTIYGRQSGSTSDMSGILVDVQSAGQAYLSITDMTASIIQTTNPYAIIYQIGRQDGVLDPSLNTFIGSVFNATVGSLGPALLTQSSNTAVSSWAYILQNSVNGAINFQINNSGDINAGTNYMLSASSGSLGLGTNSPAYNLDVEGTSSTTAIFRGLTTFGSQIVMDSTAAGKNNGIIFSDAGTPKWQFLKQTDNSLQVYDAGQGRYPLQVSTGGQTTLGEYGQIVLPSSAEIYMAFPVQIQNYTVATLPTCPSSATIYSMAVVTDALTPTYNGTLTGGSSTKIPVFCNGTAWVSI